MKNKIWLYEYKPAKTKGHAGQFAIVTPEGNTVLKGTGFEEDVRKAVQAVEYHDRLVSALRSADLAVSELFKELGNKVAGNWGIINDNLLKVDQLRKDMHHLGEV